MSLKEHRHLIKLTCDPYIVQCCKRLYWRKLRIIKLLREENYSKALLQIQNYSKAIEEYMEVIAK